MIKPHANRSISIIVGKRRNVQRNLSQRRQSNVLRFNLGQFAGADTEYSPYLQHDYPDEVLFGDTHLHTAYSADVGLTGTTTPARILLCPRPRNPDSALDEA